MPGAHVAPSRASSRCNSRASIDPDPSSEDIALNQFSRKTRRSSSDAKIAWRSTGAAIAAPSG
jgi:hypothetical protein